MVAMLLPLTKHYKGGGGRRRKKLLIQIDTLAIYMYSCVVNRSKLIIGGKEILWLEKKEEWA